MHITTLDAAGIHFIKSYEGFRTHPYLDVAGVPTIGYGCTYYADGHRVRITDAPITQQRADQLFARSMRQYELSVDSFTRDDINQQKFNALTSFCYNEGAGKLKSSSLLKKVNEDPSDPSIHAEFCKWIYAAGQVSDGLLARRKAEADLYFS